MTCRARPNLAFTCLQRSHKRGRCRCEIGQICSPQASGIGTLSRPTVGDGGVALGLERAILVACTTLDAVAECETAKRTS